MAKNNADQTLKKQLIAARKAIKYVHGKSAERHKILSAYLNFPDISSPDEFITDFLRTTKKL